MHGRGGKFSPHFDPVLQARYEAQDIIIQAPYDAQDIEFDAAWTVLSDQSFKHEAFEVGIFCPYKRSCGTASPEMHKVFS